MFYFESRSSGPPVRRALALHLDQPPRRPGSQNQWSLHLLRLKEVEVEVTVESEVEVVEVRRMAAEQRIRLDLEEKVRQKQHN